MNEWICHFLLAVLGNQYFISNGFEILSSKNTDLDLLGVMWLHRMWPFDTHVHVAISFRCSIITESKLYVCVSTVYNICTAEVSHFYHLRQEEVLRLVVFVGWFRRLVRSQVLSNAPTRAFVNVILGAEYLESCWRYRLHAMEHI